MVKGLMISQVKMFELVIPFLREGLCVKVYKKKVEIGGLKTNQFHIDTFGNDSQKDKYEHSVKFNNDFQAFVTAIVDHGEEPFLTLLKDNRIQVFY